MHAEKLLARRRRGPMKTSRDVAHAPPNGFEDEGELPGGKNVRADVRVVIRVVNDGYVHVSRLSAVYCTDWLPGCSSPALALRTSFGSVVAVLYAQTESGIMSVVAV